MNDVAVTDPGNTALPPALNVAVADGVCDPCNPAPVTKAVDVKLAADVTQVAQAIVPVLVIVPPVIGDVVATLVTVPLPTLASTKAVVASLVVLSPGLCVVAVVPFGSAGVPETFAAVPVVFWFKVGTSET